MFTRLFSFPSTNQALLAIIAWPVFYAAACWHTPQLAELLSGLGLRVSMWQVFQAGFTAYCLLLGIHRLLNRRYFVRYAPDIERHRTLTMARQGLISAGLTQTPEYEAIADERSSISDRLGFLVDADNFYRKLTALTRVFDWLRRQLKQF
jgi:hypothetical protein